MVAVHGSEKGRRSDGIPGHWARTGAVHGADKGGSLFSHFHREVKPLGELTNSFV